MGVNSTLGSLLVSWCILSVGMGVISTLGCQLIPGSGLAVLGPWLWPGVAARFLASLAICALVCGGEGSLGDGFAGALVGFGVLGGPFGGTADQVFFA